MQNDKLLPCPFCGGEAELYQHYPYMKRRVVSAVHCKKCRANSGTWGRKYKAIETWNTRKPMERIIERLEEEKQILKVLKNDCIALSDSEVIGIEEKAYNFAIGCVSYVGKE